MLRTKMGYDEYIGPSRYVTGLIMVWPLKQARRAKSCAAIGYPSGQDMAILPFRDYTLCLPVIPFNKSFTDQDRSVN